jgi:hypothetical protein
MIAMSRIAAPPTATPAIPPVLSPLDDPLAEAPVVAAGWPVAPPVALAVRRDVTVVGLLSVTPLAVRFA